MGYGEVLLGHLVRGKLVDDRIDDWGTRLEADHDLTAEELDTLAPYIEYVSRYGSRTELFLLALALTGAAFASNPAANPTGKMGLGLLLVAGLYLLAALVIARTRSVVAWSVLMATFVVHTVVGAVFVSPASLVPGVLGLYLGYRAARDADYGIPFLSVAGPRSDS